LVCISVARVSHRKASVEMIIRLLILGLLLILQTMVNHLPVGILPAGVYTAFATGLSYLAGWNTLFPLDTLLTVLKLTIGFQLVVWFWELGVWVYGRIRGIAR